MIDVLEMTDASDGSTRRDADSLGQRFMKPGSYRYHVLPWGGECLIRQRPFTVLVAGGPASGASMRHHRVTVRFSAGHFVVEPEVVAIAAGDLVLWQSPTERAFPYVVAGEREFQNGQTVFFTIAQGPGTSMTDERLIVDLKRRAAS